MNSLGSLYSFGSKLLDIESLESVYETFVSEAAKLVGAQYGSIFLIKEDGLQRVYASSRKLYSVFPRENGLTTQTLKDLVPVVYDVKGSQEKIRRMGIKSVLMIPLIYKQKPIGILTLLSKKKEIFSEKESRMLQLIGVVASSSIVKARLVEELNTAVESRDLFIAMASHELRTPLTAITVYSQILKKKAENGKASKKIVSSLSDEIIKFNGLVRGLLQLNTVQSGRLSYSFSPCNLDAILVNAAKTFKTCFPSNNIILNFQKRSKFTVFGDKEKLTQVFTNLLNNAGKFSPEKSKVVISLSATRSTVEVAITDSGPGIPKKDIPHIFSKFYKGTSNQPGLGLGLFLVKLIIEKHQGSIFFTTKHKKGTTFIVRLPRSI